MSTAPAGRTRVFISYAHKDAAYLAALQNYRKRAGKLPGFIREMNRRSFVQRGMGMALSCPTRMLDSRVGT